VVTAAAADLAAQVAEVVLADRVKGLKSDPQVDHALGQLADRLQ
jgi:F-type H+-transporting ATPase subunit b